MNRRDMLHESLRSAIGALPAVMGIIPGLTRVLGIEKAHKGNVRPSCFPSSRTKTSGEDTPITQDEEARL